MAGLDTVLLVAVTLLGAVVGSFLNVVIVRVPRRTFFSDGSRSICANPDCRQPIRWTDNVPVIGWLRLRGRARCCGAKISIRYPLVEALTAALFLALWLWPPYGPVIVAGRVDPAAALAFVFHAFFVANLIANTFIDIDHRILPDVLTKSALAVGLLGSLLVPGLAGPPFEIAGMGERVASLWYSVVGAGCGYAVTEAVRQIARLVFRKEAMGYGDVKLMAAIGAFLGWFDVLLVFLLGCLYGAAIGTYHRWRTGDSYIPFGPFLAAGAITVLMVGDRVRTAIVALQRWQATSPDAPLVSGIVALVCAVLLILLVRRGRAR